MTRQRINSALGRLAEEPFVQAGENFEFQSGTVIGLRYKPDSMPFKIGRNGFIRSGSTIYGDVVAGDDFQTGHNAVIREHTIFGNHIVVGTNTVIDGYVTIGDFVKIESNCYIPTHVAIGSRVFIGPGTILTNDRYPQKMRDQYKPEGPVIEDGVTLGGGVVVVPGVRIGRGSFVAAGTVVTKDIPPMSLVKGVPGRVFPLPEKLRELNMAKNWRKYLNE
ncbi:MAG: DapH/DapD/GlmU-related protein [Thermodesulfobacteriota bacterium]